MKTLLQFITDPIYEESAKFSNFPELCTKEIINRDWTNLEIIEKISDYLRYVQMLEDSKKA